MRKESIVRIFAAILAMMSLNAGAYVHTYYTANSKLSTGRWVKIKVTQTGINEVTYDQLREMGFENPENVSVYGYGGLFLGNAFSSNLPDDLPVQPVYRGNDKICFYGESAERFDVAGDTYKAVVKRNTYSTAGYYFLSDVNPGASKAPTSYNFNLSASTSKTTHCAVDVIEREVICPGMGGYRFFGPEFRTEPSQTFSFTAMNADTESVGRFGYVWAGKSKSQLRLQFQTNNLSVLYQSNSPVSAITNPDSGKLYMTKSGSMNITMKDNSDPVYSFTASVVDNGADIEFSAIDYAWLAYRRKNDLTGVAQLRMIFAEVNTNMAFEVSGVNSNTQVWNVTSPMNVFAYKTAIDEPAGVLKGSFEKKYASNGVGHAYLIAFDPAKQQYPVEVVGEVPNQNLHNHAAPDMLIITNKTMRPYAEELASIHEKYQDLKVLVFDHEQILNEFSSGAPSAMAYRRAAKMLYDRGPARFKFLLFYGAGLFDNRGLIYDNTDNLLTYQCENEEDAADKSSAYCADSYFGMLQDSYAPANIHFTHMDINVSRIPTNRPDYAQRVNKKSFDYLTNPPIGISRNRALLLCDDGDNGSHLAQSEEVDSIICSIAPHATVTKVYNSMYPWTNNDAQEARAAITQALVQGQHYWCYTGHGKPDAFTAENLWNKNYVNETNYNILPVTFLATCDALSFDRQDNGIAETMLYKDNGGSIAVVAASRTVYKECNQYLSTAFATQLFDAEEGDYIGDVYRKAQNASMTTSETKGDVFIGVNNLCFNMIGDPALPLHVAARSVATTKINEQEVTGDVATFSIYPLAENHIIGTIVDANNAVDADFNGQITLTIYEAPVDVNTYTDGGDPSVVVNRREDVMTEITVPVVNGVFDAQVDVPVALRPGISNHVSYFAMTDDKKSGAQGVFNRLVVLPYDETKAVADQTAPIISEMYLDTPEFADFGNVGSSATLYATVLSDETGMCVSAVALGASTKLILDGTKSFPEAKTAFVTDINGNSTLKFPLPDLEDGLHTLTLSVADNAGNRSERTISFYVINNSVKSAVVVEERPARVEATINISHNFHSEPSGRLVVEDINGEVIFSRENCSFPYKWNLKDVNGMSVPDGTYNCYAILNAENQYSSTPKVKIIVVKQ